MSSSQFPVQEGRIYELPLVLNGELMVKYNRSTGAKEIYSGIISILIAAPCKCIGREIAFSLCPLSRSVCFTPESKVAIMSSCGKQNVRQACLYIHPMSMPQHTSK